MSQVMPVVFPDGRPERLEKVIEASRLHALKEQYLDTSPGLTLRMLELRIERLTYDRGKDRGKLKQLDELIDSLKKSRNMGSIMADMRAFKFKGVGALLQPFRKARREQLKEIRNKIVQLHVNPTAEVDPATRRDTIDGLLLLAQAESDTISKLRRSLLDALFHPAMRDGWYGWSTRNQASRYFYDDFAANPASRSHLLKNSILTYTGNAKKASLYSEIAYDYFGPLRIGLGALISNSAPYAPDSTGPTEETIQDQAQRLFGGGGNASISFGLPIVGYTTNKNLISLRLHYAPRLSFDLPRIGVDTNVVAQNFDNGAAFLFHVNGILDRISVFGQVRYSHISGNSLFNKNLGRGTDKGLDVWQLTGGLALNGSVRLTMNWYLGDQFIQDNFKFRVGLQLIPN